MQAVCPQTLGSMSHRPVPARGNGDHGNRSLDLEATQRKEVSKKNGTSRSPKELLQLQPRSRGGRAQTVG